MSMMNLAAQHLQHVGSSLAYFQADKIDSGNAKTLTTFVIVAALALFFQMVAIVGIAVVIFKLRSEVISHLGEWKAKAMPLIDKSHGLVDDLTPKVKDITAKVQTLVTDLTPTIKGITTKTETLITELSPTIKGITAKTETLIAELSPQITGITAKVHTITGHVEEMSGVARDKVNEFSPTISAANETAKSSIALTKETVAKTNETVRATVADVNEKTRGQIDRFNGIVSDALDATVKLGKAIEYGVTQPAKEVAGFASGAKATVEHLFKSYAGLFKFGSKGKPAPRPPAAKPVVPHAPGGMGTEHASQSQAGYASEGKKEYMDERDLGL